MSKDLRRLAAPDRTVRLEALRCLFELAGAGREDGAAALRFVVMRYRRFDQEIYTRTLNRLEWFGDTSLAGPLLDALADDDYGCQAWTARACGQLGLTAAEPTLIDLLAHPDGLVREGACEALGWLPGADAIDHLARRLDDPADFVRAAASEALADIGGPDALERLLAALEARRFPRLGHLVAALGRFGGAGFDRLAAAVHDPDPEMRFWAARALGATGDARAAEILVRLAAEDHATTGTGAHVSTAAKKALKTWRRRQVREERD